MVRPIGSTPPSARIASISPQRGISPPQGRIPSPRPQTPPTPQNAPGRPGGGGQGGGPTAPNRNNGGNNINNNELRNGAPPVPAGGNPAQQRPDAKPNAPLGPRPQGPPLLV